MDTYEMRLRCLEAARNVAGDPFATLRVAFAYETYIQLGFSTGMDVMTGYSAHRSRPETPPEQATEDPQPEEGEPAGQHHAAGILH